MVVIDQSTCTGCGMCVGDCVSSRLKLEEGKAHCTGECILCGHCVAICPANAVSISDYDMSEVIPGGEEEPVGVDRLLHMIRFRRSIRQFQDREIEREKLENIVQAGRYTATGGNRQACRFLVVQDELEPFKDLIWKGIGERVDRREQQDEASQRLTAAFHRFLRMRERDGVDYLFRNAPALVYVAADNPVDAGLAAQNMELAAVAQGLGMLYNGYLVYAASQNPEAMRWLGTEDKPIAVCMLVGYPAVNYRRSAPRKKADVRWR